MINAGNMSMIEIFGLEVSELLDTGGTVFPVFLLLGMFYVRIRYLGLVEKHI